MLPLFSETNLFTIYNLDAIQVAPDRQRQEFNPEELAELGNDIATNGLYHPIVVRTEGDRVFLVAGERRFRAIKQLRDLNIPFRFGKDDEARVIPMGAIPCNDLGEISPLEATEIELHENIKRVNLTWQERVNAENAILELAAAKAAAAGTSIPSLLKISRQVDTPGITPDSLSESRILAQHLGDPEVRKAASKKEAYKIVERKRREEYNTQLVKEMSIKPVTDRCRLIVGSCYEELTTLNTPVDVVLADPPYYIGADSMGEQANANGRQYDDSPEKFSRDMTILAELTYATVKDQGHTFIFCSIERFYELSVLFSLAGWRVWPRPIIWNKGNVGALPRPQHGPRYTYEAILFASKGDKAVYENGTDVISISPPSTRVHPDEKPVELYVELLRRVTRPGDMVLDTHCGSGTIFPAANRLSLNAIGIEKESLYAGIALRRLSSEA